MSSDNENTNNSETQETISNSNIFGIPSVVLDSSSNPFSLSQKTLEGTTSKSPKKKTGKKSAKLNESKAKRKNYPFFGQSKTYDVPSFVPESEDLQDVTKTTPTAKEIRPLVSILGEKVSSPLSGLNANSGGQSIIQSKPVQLDFEAFMKEYTKDKEVKTPIETPKVVENQEKVIRPKRAFVRVQKGVHKSVIPSLVELCVSYFMQNIESLEGKINQLDPEVKMRLLEFSRKYGWLSSANIKYFFDERTTRIEVDASTPFKKEMEIIISSSPNITHASFANSYSMDDETLQLFLRACGSKLVYLDISKCENLSTSTPKIAECPKLKILNLSGTFLGPKTALKPILKNCTELQQLLMRQCGLNVGISDVLQQYGGQLLFLDISEPKSGFQYEKAGFMKGTTSLVELRADGIQFQHKMVEEAFFLSFDNCTSLRTLSLKNVIIKDCKLDSFFSHASRLERLNIDGSQITSENFIQLAKNMTNLRALDISHCDKLGNESLQALFENTKLEELRIVGNMLMSDDQISKLKTLTNAVVITNNY